MICPDHSNETTLDEVTSDLLAAGSNRRFLVFILLDLCCICQLPLTSSLNPCASLDICAAHLVSLYFGSILHGLSSDVPF